MFARGSVFLHACLRSKRNYKGCLTSGLKTDTGGVVMREVIIKQKDFKRAVIGESIGVMAARRFSRQSWCDAESRTGPAFPRGSARTPMAGAGCCGPPHNT